MKTFATILTVLFAACGFARAQTTQPFDGRPWNVSTGNLSVQYIQASSIGAHPRPNFLEAPPPVDAMTRMKADGLVAYEDYVAWGAVEREPGKWDWTQHDAIERAVHAAGLKYVVYNWTHFPPTWLRDKHKANRTLMRCIEHDKETNYLSIFDPKTIEHYDRFYKNLSQHFRDKIDGVYACILGPYGEGNYPLYVPDFINMGHCHEGYWCADPHASRAFQAAMQKKYRDVAALNLAWNTQHKTFADVRPPKEAMVETLRIHPDLFITAADRHRWVDFLKWYHQAMIDFTEKSIRTTLKYFPAEKIRAKPGGNAGGVNPIAWGTYCPGYAKMAAKYPEVVLQPADWHGAYFGDKWVATAYHFYGVPLGTEPAGGLDHKGFVKRLFSDASCGTRQLFTYDFDKHSADIRQYAHLITGQPGETEIAVLCPTTLYRLGGNLQPTIVGAQKLRDLADFDVLDELLIQDGALKPDRYKLLVVFQADFIDQPILDAIDKYLDAGGRILIAGNTRPRNLDGKTWERNVPYAIAKLPERFKKLAAGMKGFDGVADSVWITRRDGLTLMLDTKVSDTIRVIESVSLAPAAR
ncbi:MAG: family 14 glycosylhydrolase [Tepidisphaeraceae bacterium]